MMKKIVTSALLASALVVSGCVGTGPNSLFEGDVRTPDKTKDRGRDTKDLSQLQAGIWIDPNGCDHWIIDDGIEGYLSQRLQPNGKPVCTGHGGETYAYGPFKQGSEVNGTISE